MIKDNKQDQVELEGIKDFYDNVYYLNKKASGKPAAHLRRLASLVGVRPGMQVLDVACGSGEWLKVCNESGASVAGVDLSDKAINLCRQALPEGEFYAQPAETLPYESGRFDVVTCLGSLEHFVKPRQALEEMARVAKPGAVFILLVPNADFLTRKLGLYGGTYQVDAKEVVRTLEAWSELFESAGLTVERRWKDLHVISKQWITIGKWYGWPFRAAQALALAIWPLRWQYQVYHWCVAARKP